MQHVGDAQQRGAVALEHPDRGGVQRGEARVQVEQVVLRRRKVAALPRAREGDDGNTGGGGGVKLEKAPWAGEDVFGLKEHDHV